MTPSQPSQAVPKLPSHPEPHSMTWSRLELETIEDYGVRCFEAGRAELARPQEVAAVGDAVRMIGASTFEDVFLALDRAHELGGPPHVRINALIDAREAASRVPVALPAEPQIVTYRNGDPETGDQGEMLINGEPIEPAPKQGDAKEAKRLKFCDAQNLKLHTDGVEWIAQMPLKNYPDAELVFFGNTPDAAILASKATAAGGGK